MLLNPRGEKKEGKEETRRKFKTPGNLICMLSELPDASLFQDGEMTPGEMTPLPRQRLSVGCEWARYKQAAISTR